MGIGLLGGRFFDRLALSSLHLRCLLGFTGGGLWTRDCLLLFLKLRAALRTADAALWTLRDLAGSVPCLPLEMPIPARGLPGILETSGCEAIRSGSMAVVRKKRIWLPRLDSNQGQQIQSPT